MRGSRDLRREAWVIGIAVATVAILYRYAWLPSDPQAALRHASETLGLPVTGVGNWFSGWTLGDGQVFAVIAADPLGLDEGARVYQPAYRYGRVGFGWLVWAASLGQAEWVPYGMAIVGVGSIGGLYLLANRLRPRLGLPAWLIVINPAVFIGFAGDTAEALGILALALAMATGKWWSSAAVGVIRPSFLVALLGKWRLLRWGVLSAGVLGVVWILRFGYDPQQYGGRLGLPAVGYIDAASTQSILLGLLGLATLLIGVRQRDWSWVGAGLFVLCFSSVVVADPSNAWRAAGMLFVLWAFGPGYETPELHRVAASQHVVGSRQRPSSSLFGSTDQR